MPIALQTAGKYQTLPLLLLRLPGPSTMALIATGITLKVMASGPILQVPKGCVGHKKQDGDHQAKHSDL